jgi:hypothetical protein
MFIIFDSSNQIFDRLIKSTKSQQTSDRYPTYEIDIPESCILS